MSSPSTSPPPSKTSLSSSPPSVNYHHHHRNQNNKSSPSSPLSRTSGGERIHVARVEKKRYPQCSNDHIIEATLMSGHQAPKITRASSSESTTRDDGFLGVAGATSSYSRCSEDRLLWSLDSSAKVSLQQQNIQFAILSMSSLFFFLNTIKNLYCHIK